jgi:hypothetical protein
MELADYLDVFNEMKNEALHYEKLGKKNELIELIEPPKRVAQLFEEAILVKNCEDAEVYYNEIRGELFACEEIIEESDFSDEED